MRFRKLARGTLAALTLATALNISSPATAYAAPAPTPAVAVADDDCDGCAETRPFVVPAPVKTVGGATLVHRAEDGSEISRTILGIPKKSAERKSRVLETTAVHYLGNDDTASFALGEGERVEVYGPWGPVPGGKGVFKTWLPSNRAEDPSSLEIAALERGPDGRMISVITYDELKAADKDHMNFTYNSGHMIPGKKGPNGSPYCASNAFDLIVSRKAADRVIEKQVIREVPGPVREVVVREVHHHYEAAPEPEPIKQKRIKVRKAPKCDDGIDNDGDRLVDFRQPGDMSIDIGGYTFWGVDENGNGELDGEDLFRDPGCNGPNDGEKWGRKKTKTLQRWIAGKEPSAPFTEAKVYAGMANDQYTFEVPGKRIKVEEQFDASSIGVSVERFSPRTRIDGTVMFTQGTEDRSNEVVSRGESAFGAMASVDKKVLGPLTVGAEIEHVTHRTYDSILGGPNRETSDQSNTMFSLCGGLTFGEFSGNTWGTLQGCATAQPIVESYQGGPGYGGFNAETHDDFIPNIKFRLRSGSDEGLYFDARARLGMGQSTIWTNADKVLVEQDSNFFNAALETGYEFGNGWLVGGRFKYSMTEDSFEADPSANLSRRAREWLNQEGTHNNNRLEVFVGKRW